VASFQRRYDSLGTSPIHLERACGGYVACVHVGACVAPGEGEAAPLAALTTLRGSRSRPLRQAVETWQEVIGIACLKRRQAVEAGSSPYHDTLCRASLRQAGLLQPGGAPSASSANAAAPPHP
jgi:hypothetical protein